MVEKELCQEAQVLAVEFVLLAVYFEDRHRWICDRATNKVWVVGWGWWRPVDLIACDDKHQMSMAKSQGYMMTIIEKDVMQMQVRSFSQSIGPMA